mgnify:CR=1 FL=1
MRIITSALVIFIIVWSGFWWITSNKVKNSVESWLSKTDQTLNRSYYSVTSAGYPNRIDINIENFSVNNRKYNFSVSSEFIQLLSLVYNQTHWLGVVKTPIELKLKKSSFHISGPPIKASIQSDRLNETDELVSEGQDLEFRDLNNNKWILKKFLLATKREPRSTYLTHLSIKNLKIPSNFLHLKNSSQLVNQTIENISFDGKIHQDKYKKDSINNYETINITDLNAKMNWDLINIHLIGTVKFNEKGIINGSFKLTLNDWQKILLAVESENLLKKKLYQKIKAAVTFLASQLPSQKSSLITIPITIKDNDLFLGPLKIGGIDLS